METYTVAGMEFKLYGLESDGKLPPTYMAEHLHNGVSVTMYRGYGETKHAAIMACLNKMQRGIHVNYCAYRTLVNSRYKLCGNAAPFMLNGTSLCSKHVMDVHATGRPVAVFNETTKDRE